MKSEEIFVHSASRRSVLARSGLSSHGESSGSGSAVNMVVVVEFRCDHARKAQAFCRIMITVEDMEYIQVLLQFFSHQIFSFISRRPSQDLQVTNASLSYSLVKSGSFKNLHSFGVVLQH